MGELGAPLRLVSTRGKKADGADLRRLGAAAVLAVAALQACATGSAPGAPQEQSERRMRSALEAGLDLYEGGEFVLAARRFRDASVLAGVLSQQEMQRRAVTSECLSWLRSRRLAELAECSGRLESIQRNQRRPEPGVNTLIAMGAIAGGRPLPALRVPHSVRRLLASPEKEDRR